MMQADITAPRAQAERVEDARPANDPSPSEHGAKADDWDRLTDELDRLVAQTMTARDGASRADRSDAPRRGGPARRPAARGATGLPQGVKHLPQGVAGVALPAWMRRPSSARLAGALTLLVMAGIAGATAFTPLTLPGTAIVTRVLLPPHGPSETADIVQARAVDEPGASAANAPLVAPPVAASARMATPSETTASPASPNDSPSASRDPGARVADPTGLVRLVWSTLLAVRHGQETGNYTVLRDMATPTFREMQTAASLEAAFAPLAARVDLTDVLLVAPIFSRAERTEEGALRLTGSFALEPSALAFDLYYAPETAGQATRWQLMGASLFPLTSTARAPATQASASSPPEVSDLAAATAR